MSHPFSLPFSRSMPTRVTTANQSFAQVISHDDDAYISVAADPAQAQRLRGELRAILAVVLRAGQILLENGANTARVEDTMQRFGQAYGADWLDTHVTPTGILVSIHRGEEHRTRILRILINAVDLSRVAAVFELLGRVEQGGVSRGEALAALDRIAAQPRVYNRLFTMFAVGVAGSSFCLLFGGGFWEFAVVFLAGMLMQLVRSELVHRKVNRLLMTGIVSATVTGLVLLFGTLVNQFSGTLAALLPWAPTPQVALGLAIAAGGILPIPGILMVSSIADLFRGDTVAGMTRATMGLLTIFAIGIGIWLTLLVTGEHVTIALSTTPPTMLLGLLAAGFGAAGFGTVFDVPPRQLFFAGLVGSIAYGTRLLAVGHGVPLEAAALLSGLAIGLSAELWSRLFNAPTSLFAIPGFIPMVPGVLAFRAVLNFALADYNAGTSDMVRAALITCSLAAGLGVVAAVTKLRGPAFSTPQ